MGVGTVVNVGVGGGPGKFKSNLSMAGVLGHIIVWILIVLVTFGVGIFFWPYAAMKLVLNSIEVHSGAGIQRCHCDLGFSEQLGHILIWAIISVLTVGIAYPFYIYGVARTAINRTEVR